MNHLSLQGITQGLEERADQLLSAFYSDEYNTQIIKTAVKEAIESGKSCVHVSASLYDDTKERADLAQKYGFTTVMIAANLHHTSAIERLPTIDPSGVVRSYQRFSTKFKEEWLGLFNQVMVYDVNGEEPVLIAIKDGIELNVGNNGAYVQFIANQHLDPGQYTTPVTGMNVIQQEFQGNRRTQAGQNLTVGQEKSQEIV